MKNYTLLFCDKIECKLECNIFKILKGYNPILVGTIPIDIGKSDLDIICEVYDFDKFEKVLNLSFNKYERFNIKRYINKDY